ncbi:unnamed protein product [Parascedosporium putredinis]|uniref:Calmodulin n=1 Tax=Parascedosporium putredinis TaxID=1442378 RepID=A0A9P1GUE4_9PEZI|nr:unnamed protein product [Parascedosporium putredinis]CAI7987293.1 unnamed protein product [Parascedosporium putredinis]
MPPKRRPGGVADVSNAPKPRQTKLAKEHNVTAQEEAEIKEAFSLFSEPMEGEKHGVIPTNDHSEFLSILDPDDEGYASYEPFFAICALKFHARDHDSDAHARELDEAYRLFTHGSAAGPITLTHLRRVAALLKEDVADELLKDMISEANSGQGTAVGVAKDEFDDVMRRAGVWR